MTEATPYRASDSAHPLDAEALLSVLKQKLATYLDQHDIGNPLMIGIHSGGAWLAARLHAALALRSPLGALNIAFYRDDFARAGLQASEHKSHLPVDVSERDVVLVDDILYTGRTIRGAINELFDYGRPKSITLVCLLVRDGRQLPIQADVCAQVVELGAHEVLKLRGPEPLYIERKLRAQHARPA
jgi:pyrimidine operon attenuation protein / uracil phosphoribosyltransferase